MSDDNAYAESLFRNAKYRPEFHAKGFVGLETASAWAADFVHWYNVDHRYSGIQYVSPSQRHEGEDQAMVRRHTQLAADWDGHSQPGARLRDQGADGLR